MLHRYARGIWFRAALAFAGVLAASALSFGQSVSPSSGVDLKAIDKTADPCQNFYQYACGSWIKANPVPPEYSRWSRFNELLDRNQQILRTILDDSAQHQDRSPIDQKIGGFYAACMDEKAVDQAGYDPIKPGIAKIQALKDKDSLAAEVAALQNQGVTAFFNFRSGPDPDNSRMTIADADQGGLGCPTRVTMPARKMKRPERNTSSTFRRCCS